MAERRGTKALEHWCRRITEGYNGVKIENMTTSWRDGLAFCAMIHHFRPELINFDELKKTDIYENNDLAFSTAEKYLGIAALLDAADMAAYDVPDRLSILTYLSQFYKTFGHSQNAANSSIAKQRTSNPEQNSEEQLSTTKPPSPKMTPTVGILRRDPCQKCQLPVFLAERMLVGKHVYHRTCLKCARCASQLTPGSFYETEVNNEYCCETCPDEDTDVAAGGGGVGSGSSDIKVISNHNLTPSRNSISERLAFFEQNRSVTPLKINEKVSVTEGQEVLESSVSDEEKREHINGLDDKIGSNEQNKIGMVYKHNPALSTFLQQTVSETDSDSLAQPNDAGVNLPVETTPPRFTVTAQLSLHTEEDPIISKPESEKVPELLPKETEVPSSQPIDKPDDIVPPLPEDRFDEPDDSNKENDSNLKEPKQNIELEPIQNEQKDEVAKHQTDDQLETQVVSEAVPQLPESAQPTIEKQYPEKLNPFDTDDSSEEAEEETNGANKIISKTAINPKVDDSLNPFDSSDDEVELDKQKSEYAKRMQGGSAAKIPPPRPPPPQISRSVYNGNQSEGQLDAVSSNLSNKKIPLPTPRTSLSQSRTSTPESTPLQTNRFDRTLGSSQSLNRNTDSRGSSTSLPSSSEGTVRSRKSHRAPVAPRASQELFPSTKSGSNDIINSDAYKAESNGSYYNSPKLSNKKRQAPPPPKPARLDTDTETKSRNLLSEGEILPLNSMSESLPNANRRLIPLDQSLLADEVGSLSNCDDDQKQHVKNEEDVVYRRILVPPAIDTPTHGEDLVLGNNRQLEKLKDNKEAQNRTRQTQLIKTPLSVGGQFAPPAESHGFYDKSIHGKWKRRKGPAPGVPIPPRKLPQMLPLQEIRHELEIIEVQQQGLEKQGVILEKMIRDRCEGSSSNEIDKSIDTPSVSNADNSAVSTVEQAQNSKEVEDLILQLFELVNEKNELFRRQAELMYLRRQHRLEQDQADIEYEIRVLMGQPEHNKTDSDKAREELLIARLVEVVELRNEVIDCLETDRLREAEEDLSIKERLHIYNAKRETSAILEKSKTPNIKLSKKEKKQLKEVKKLSKSKNHDLDKDADESEIKLAQDKVKKKRKLFF